MRCFVALGMENGPQSALAPWLLSAQARFPEIAVTRAANLHLTLAFMADVGEQIALVEAAVEAAAARSQPWSLRWTSPGVFPSRSRPRVLWLGVDGGRALDEVHTALHAGLTPAGLASEGRAFRPHLTLGRVRRQDISRERFRDMVAHLETLPVPGPSRVVALVLYRSQLGRGSAVHTPLLTVSM